MADGTVDSLNIQIEAEARSAEKSLNSLSNTLLKVNKNLQSSVGTIRKVSKEVGALEYAISSIGKININSSGINKTANALSWSVEQVMKTPQKLKSLLHFILLQVVNFLICLQNLKL